MLAGFGVTAHGCAVTGWAGVCDRTATGSAKAMVSAADTATGMMMPRCNEIIHHLL